MAESSSGIGGTRFGGPTTIPGRARTVTPDSAQQHAPADQRKAPSARQAEERQYINVDGRRFDMAAPRGTYVNILV